MQRSVVVFPQPEGPRSVTNSPCSMFRSIPATATSLPKRLMRPSISTVGTKPSPSGQHRQGVVGVEADVDALALAKAAQMLALWI